MPISRKVILSAFVLYLILFVFPDTSCTRQQYKFGGTPSRWLRDTVPKSICFSEFKASKTWPSRKTRLPQAPYIPPKTNFGGYLVFLWMLFISADLIFIGSYIQQHENTKTILLLCLYFFLHKIADVANAATEMLTIFLKNSH